MRNLKSVILAATGAVLIIPVSGASAQAGGDLHPQEHLPAGAASVQAEGRKAFSQPFATLDETQDLDFLAGRALFKKLWVSSPSSTKASDGLGPLYNARSCLACHPGNGRGFAPNAGERPVSLVMKLAGAPDYGAQLQTQSLSGLAAEAVLKPRYEVEVVALSGGETAKLHRPFYDIENPAYGAFPDATRMSPRVAPPLIGLGLIEAIDAADILAGEDPQDADGNGVSGRAVLVPSQAAGGGVRVGRFGRKAAMTTVRAQSADAFSHDIGISTPLFPAPWGDCSAAQAECRDRPHGDGDVRGAEVSGQALDLVTLYAASLAVPVRDYAGDADVRLGKGVFHAVGCAACHRPSFVTGDVEGHPERSAQLIWPYSDFLLHDMGDGLGDDKPEGVVSGREWKTPPLWGIGRTEDVGGREGYLHDGRARSLLEAILWHGGEARAMRDRVVNLPPEERAALIRFLESL